MEYKTVLQQFHLFIQLLPKLICVLSYAHICLQKRNLLHQEYNKQIIMSLQYNAETDSETQCLTLYYITE